LGLWRLLPWFGQILGRLPATRRPGVTGDPADAGSTYTDNSYDNGYGPSYDTYDEYYPYGYRAYAPEGDGGYYPDSYTPAPGIGVQVGPVGIGVFP
jgi:hypothetical protein